MLYASPNRTHRQTTRRTRASRASAREDSPEYGDPGQESYDRIRQPSAVQHGEDIDQELEKYLKQQTSSD